MNPYVIVAIVAAGMVAVVLLHRFLSKNLADRDPRYDKTDPKDGNPWG